MKKISFLGDSIRLQYAPVVSEMLGEDYEFFAPKENCRFAKYTLRGMYDWRADMEGSQIVHWNNGLWDICDIFGDGKLFSSEAEYVDTMLRIADILQKRHEIVIFATTTPVRPEHIHNKTADIVRYNEILVPLLKEKGILINDLHAVVAADPSRYISDDYIHLTPEGIQVCADAVTKAIRAAEALLPAEEEA